MASIRWCQLCHRNVQPQRKFNFVAFFLLLGFIYLFLVYPFKRKVCPICGSKSLGPAQYA